MLRPRTQGALRQSLFTSVFSPVFTAVFGGAPVIDAYAIGGASPELVAAFLTAADGTTEGEYFRTGGAVDDFSMFTFSRSGTATYFDSSGTLQTAADGVARRNAYYYNGSAWAKGGLQLESAAATNLEPYSNDFTSGDWYIVLTDSLTLTAAGANGPDGNMSLSRLEITDTTNEVHGVSNTRGFSANTTYCMSAFVRNDDQRYVGLWAWGLDNHWVHVTFDLQTGTKTDTQTGATSGTVVGADIEDYGGGLYRIWMAFSVADVSSTEQYALFFNSSGTPTLSAEFGSEAYAGTAGVGCYFGFFQFEAGSVPTSYIPTTGSTVTRAAETLSIAGADTPANTIAMSISMKGLMTYADEGAAAQETFLRWYADANNFITLDLDTDSTATGEVNANQSAAGTLDTVVAGAEYSPGVNVAFNIASRHTSGAINVAKDGTAATADTTPTALADLSSTALAPGYDFNGFISELRIWGTDIGDSGIAEVTS